MNIAVDMLAEGAAEVEKLLDRAGSALGDAIVAVGTLNAAGILAAHRAGVSPGLIGEVLEYAGRLQSDLGHAALMLQGVHASLHEALERLAPNDDANRSGGGEGKTPPPKP